MQCVADFHKENNRLPVVLEIGCADGQGTMRFAGFCDLVVCVDPMVNDRPDIDSRVESDADRYPMEPQKLAAFERRTRDFNVKLVMAPSLWPSTLPKVKEVLGDKKVDILVIDGCHHPFEAVWGDFETYYPLVSRDGFVIFDDLYEECIAQAMDKALSERKMTLHERWSVSNPNILQDVASLRKTEQ